MIARYSWCMRGLGIGAAMGLLATGTCIAATAQEPSPLAMQRPTLTMLPPVGEPVGAPTLNPYELFTPLRLSLVAGVIPVGPALGKACGDDPEAGVAGAQSRSLPSYTLLRLTPHLVLHGFSNVMPCALDSGAGGGITYTVPIDRNVWLVGAAGMYAVPKIDQLPVRKSSELRVDVMTKQSSGQTWSVGVGTRGLHIGGTFF